MPSLQRRYWILTMPHQEFTPYLPQSVCYIKGQLELGSGGFLHWQVVAGFTKKVTHRAVSSVFGTGIHSEPTRSEAAIAYVWKAETRVSGTQFELGARPIQRNSKPDWDRVWDMATSGKMDEIPASIRVCHYRTLRAIRSDYAKPVGIERTVYVFWGSTGTGKSRRAWDEAGSNAYPKDPRNKFWDGYQGQENVVIDEFRGAIDISHLLRWFDRYPVNVEIKGSSVPLQAKRIWITSNLSPAAWYPLLDDETHKALGRRLLVTFFNKPL